MTSVRHIGSRSSVAPSLETASIASSCDSWALSRTARLLLAAVLFASLSVRVWQCQESLWLDELHTSWAAASGWSDVAPRARIGNQSPLFFYAVRLSLVLFGEHEAAVRLPSLAAGLLLTAVVFWAAWRLTRDAAAATTAGLLTAFDPQLIFYAQEARPYVWVQLVGVVHVASLWRLLERPTLGRRLAFQGSGVVLFYCHYTAALLLAADVAIFLVRKSPFGWSPTRYTARRLMLDLGMIVSCCLPVWPHLAQVAARRSQWAEMITVDSPWQIVRVMPLSVCVAWPLGMLAVAAATSRWRTRRDEPRDVERGSWSPLAAVAAWYLIPVSAAWVATAWQIAPLFLLRYVAASAAAPPLFAGLLVARLPDGVVRGVRLRAAAAGLLVVVCLVRADYVSQWRDDGRLLGDRRENWRAAAERCADRSTTALPVVLCPGLVEDSRLSSDRTKEFREYCGFPLRGLYRLGESQALFAAPTDATAFALSAAQREAISAAGGAWLVVRGSREIADPIERAAEKLLEATAVERANYGDVHVTRFDCGRTTAREAAKARRTRALAQTTGG